ncbi:MAG TPA: hypothetical protein PLP19_10320 [bacterium]|nr:hypothetical protein [bacterium]HPN43873.1 hypothetical protein [bacterium]
MIKFVITNKYHVILPVGMLLLLLLSCSKYCLIGKQNRAYWVYEYQENYAKALEQLEICLLNDFVDIDVYYHLGVCNFRIKKFALSAQYFRTATLLLPEVKSTYNVESDKNYIKAEVFFNNAIYDSAAIYYEKTIPTFIGLCRVLGTRSNLE